MNVFLRIRDHIAKGETEQAIVLLKELTDKEFSEQANDLKLFSNRFFRNEKDNAKGILNNDDYRLESNRVVDGLLRITDELEQEERKRRLQLEAELLRIEELKRKENEAKKRHEEERLRKAQEEASKNAEKEKIKDEPAENQEPTPEKEGGNPDQKPKDENKHTFLQKYKWRLIFFVAISIVGLIVINAFPRKPINIYYDTEFSENKKIVNKNNLFGFVDNKLKVIIKPKYQEVKRFREGRAAIKRNDLWGFIDQNGTEINEPKFRDVLSFTNNRAAVLQNNLWGFINKQGNTIIPAKYKSVKPFIKGYAYVQKSNGLWGLIDTTGKIIINPEFEGISLFGFMQQKKTNNHALFNVAIAKKAGFCFLINKSGVPISKKYFCIEPLEQCKGGFILVRNVVNDKKLYGLIKADGKEIIEPNYNTLIAPLSHSSNFSSFCSVKNYNKAFELNDSFKRNDLFGFVISDDLFPEDPTSFELPSSMNTVRISDGLFYSNEVIIVEKENKFGFFSLDGKVITQPIFNDVSCFKNGLAYVNKDVQWGIINKEGEFIANAIYDEIRSFSEGYAAFRKDTLWGFIDVNGKERIKAKYLDVGGFKDGVAFVVPIQSRISNTIRSLYENRYKYRNFKQGDLPSSLHPLDFRANKVWYFIDKNENYSPYTGEAF